MDNPTIKGDEIAAATVSVSLNDMTRIFELAVMIDQIEVPYQSNPLKMANEAIQLMRGYASEIAALVRHD